LRDVRHVNRRADGHRRPGFWGHGLLLGLATVIGPPSSAAPVIIAGRASVIDGDTLEIRGERIRLFGIDAPESGQTCLDAKGRSYRCGQKAALVLDARIGEGVVTCERKDSDRYGRVVALCRVYGEDLGAWMVGLGWALAYRAYSTRYVAAEELARSRGLGIWAGRFVPPSEWRREHRQGTPGEP
jgi:endonuclease YncB( thermonuclease family)